MNNTLPETPAAVTEEPAGRPIPEHPDALLFTVEAAFLLGLSHRTLESLRVRGSGPPYVAVSPRAVRYERSAIAAWVASRQRRSTSDTGDPTPGDTRPAAGA